MRKNHFVIAYTDNHDSLKYFLARELYTETYKVSDWTTAHLLLGLQQTI